MNTDRKLEELRKEIVAINKRLYEIGAVLREMCRIMGKEEVNQDEQAERDDGK